MTHMEKFDWHFVIYGFCWFSNNLLHWRRQYGLRFDKNIVIYFSGKTITQSAIKAGPHWHEVYHSNMEIIKLIAFFALAAAFTYQVSYNFLINMYKIRAEFALAFQAYFLCIFKLCIFLHYHFLIVRGLLKADFTKNELFDKFIRLI